MELYIDAQPLLGPRTGIARYVECLSSVLARDEQINLSLAFNRLLKGVKEPEIHQYALATGASIVNNVYPYKVLRRLFKPNLLYHVPYDLFSKKADIFHGTNFVYTPVVKGKTIITIHDLAYMRFPETTSQRIYSHHSKWVPYSARQCDHIIADSLQTKQDIIELLKIEESKIDVIPLAADNRFKVIDDFNVKLILEKYDLPKDYILFVGTLEPRKNLTGLLQAYSALRRNSVVDTKLVIVGTKGWKFSPIFQLIQDLALQEDVIFTGFIADEDLPAIYNGARIFTMPSIYEGFGLPILEAMQCGIPVLGSNVSSLPEIIGDNGLLLQPNDTKAWAEAMYRLLTDHETHATFSNLSIQRAENFTWEKTALETMNIYQKVLSR
ncbi:glycosyltransferase family 4 protein [Paenibacillus cremeus]|uniref:Glycosyltransferase family 4 protein n=1 Tax=Paenibacillus cremeus TaxID=2163881 RepID=A0A559KCD5_9BACL|nr:glycosyltransferase family 1 protein [Paenibacillus cremeus]TVY09790.1 glycosyltransferase family 4 protein [Paenibacillus cremeus]